MATTKTATPHPTLDLSTAPPQQAPAGKPPARARRGAQRDMVVAPPAPSGDHLLTALVAAASNKDVDAAKVRALWEIHREVEAEKARLLFFKQFHDLQGVLPIINKDGLIEIREKVAGERTGKVQQSTPFATFDAIDDAVAPLLQARGFSIWFSTDAGPDGKLLVIGHLDHIGGHTRTTTFPLPAETSGSKNNVQGYGSTLSFGKRYAMIALLKIRTKAKVDRDDDGVAAGLGDRLNTKQLKAIKEAMKFKNVGEERVIAYCKKQGLEIETVEDIPVTWNDRILNLIKQAE